MSKSKLKRKTAAVLPAAQDGAVSRPDEEPNGAEAAENTPAAQDRAASGHDEKTGAVETAENTPAARNRAASGHDEKPNAAEADTNTPACADNTAPRPKKSKWFLIVMVCYMVILLGVSCFLQSSLWRYLESSQAEMDRQAAERAEQQALEKALYQAPQLAFEAWQSGLTADYWTDLWYAKAPCDFDVRESVRKVMAERFAPDAIEAYKASGFTAETPVYVLKNGEDSLARVTLAGSELDWSVSDVELLIEGAYSASVTVADRCRVLCNGKEMGREYTENSESRFHYGPLEGKLEGAVTWVSYSVEGLLLEPELTVVPHEGYSAIQTEDGAYLLGMAGDTGSYTDKSIEFVRAYLYYYMRGKTDTRDNMNSVLSHLKSGTQAYQDIRGTYNGVIFLRTYSVIDTSKTTAGNVLVWSDNCFSVDVTYDADGIYAGARYDYADATMRIYFLQTNEGYIISNFEVL